MKKGSKKTALKQNNEFTFAHLNKQALLIVPFKTKQKN